MTSESSIVFRQLSKNNSEKARKKYYRRIDFNKKYIIDCIKKYIFCFENRDFSTSLKIGYRLRLKEPGINVQETLDSLLNVPLEMIAATMQGTQMLSGGTSVIVDQSWVVIMKALNEINRRHITMIKLKHAVNFGNNSQEVRFVVVVFTPHKEKGKCHISRRKLLTQAFQPF